MFINDINHKKNKKNRSFINLNYIYILHIIISTSLHSPSANIDYKLLIFLVEANPCNLTIYFISKNQIGIINTQRMNLNQKSQHNNVKSLYK